MLAKGRHDGVADHILWCLQQGLRHVKQRPQSRVRRSTFSGVLAYAAPSAMWPCSAHHQDVVIAVIHLQVNTSYVNTACTTRHRVGCGGKPGLPEVPAGCGPKSGDSCHVRQPERARLLRANCTDGDKVLGIAPVHAGHDALHAIQRQRQPLDREHAGQSSFDPCARCQHPPPRWQSHPRVLGVGRMRAHSQHLRFMLHSAHEVQGSPERRPAPSRPARTP